MATKKSSKTTEDKTEKIAVGLTKETQALLNSYAEDEPETQFMETGNIGFDMAVSNGLGMPIGSSILIWAEPACGKTTLFGDISRRLIKMHKDRGEEYKVLYLAVEGSRELLRKIGLDEYMKSKDFIYIEKRLCWRQIEQLYDMVLSGTGAYAGVKLVVIDSVNNVLSDQNLKNSVADGDFGTKARERSNFYSKYLPMCKQKGINTFMVSQIRQKQDVAPGLYVEKKKAAVSDSDLHNADIIMKCTKNLSHVETVKLIEETAYCKEEKGILKYIMVLDPTNSSSKNRYDRTHKCEILIEKGAGVCNYYALRKILEFHGFLKKAGSYYSFTSEIYNAISGIPEKSMHRDAVDEILKDRAGDFVEFLKNAGCYSIVSKERISLEEGAVEPETEETSEEE